MATIVKKVKNGKSYYYAVQSGRRDGKPRIIWQKHLGSVEAIIRKMGADTATSRPTETVLFEAGGVSALLGIVNRLGLIEVIDKHIPKKTSQGPTIGQYMILATLNRALAPCSNVKIGDWYEGTVLRRLWGFSSKVFTSQKYWDHMSLITKESIDNIQDEIAKQVKKRFKIDIDTFLYDSTNFFTYIATANDRNEIAQRGHQKQKRNGLRQVNLALLITAQFKIPLFHTLYRGNIPDIKFFPEVTQQLLERRHAILGSSKEPTLVFDKVNLSDAELEKILYSKMYFVAGVKAEFMSDVFSTPAMEFEDISTMSGTKAYETLIEVYGKKCKAVVCYTEHFYTQQLASITNSLVKCGQRLENLQKSLLDWTLGKKTRGKRPTKSQVEASVKGMLSEQHMKKLFSVSIEENNKSFLNLQYSVNREALTRLSDTRLGRTLLITNRITMSSSEVVSVYRGLSDIEDCFKHMKNREYLRWQPAFYWTDQKLEVHTFYCVLALLLTSLASKLSKEAGINLSTTSLLNELSSIKEVVLLYSGDSGKRLKPVLSLNRMTPVQKKIAECLNIGSILEGNTYFLENSRGEK